jgi:hypothetical protein
LVKAAENMTPTEEEEKQSAEYIAGPMLPIEREFARGLRFAHLMLQATERKAHEAARLTEALNKTLVAKGILSDTEWADLLEDPTRIPRDFLP